MFLQKAANSGLVAQSFCVFQPLSGATESDMKTAQRFELTGPLKKKPERHPVRPERLR